MANSLNTPNDPNAPGVPSHVPKPFSFARAQLLALPMFCLCCCVGDVVVPVLFSLATGCITPSTPATHHRNFMDGNLDMISLGCVDDNCDCWKVDMAILESQRQMNSLLALQRAMLTHVQSTTTSSGNAPSDIPSHDTMTRCSHRIGFDVVTSLGLTPGSRSFVSFLSGLAPLESYTDHATYEDAVDSYPQRVRIVSEMKKQEDEGATEKVPTMSDFCLRLGLEDITLFISCTIVFCARI